MVFFYFLILYILLFELCLATTKDLQISANKNFLNRNLPIHPLFFLNKSKFIDPIFSGIIFLTHILHFKLQALVVSL